MDAEQLMNYALIIPSLIVIVTKTYFRYSMLAIIMALIFNSKIIVLYMQAFKFVIFKVPFYLIKTIAKIYAYIIIFPLILLVEINKKFRFDKGGLVNYNHFPK